MRKLLLALVALVTLVSCGVTSSTLRSDGYDEQFVSAFETLEEAEVAADAAVAEAESSGSTEQLAQARAVQSEVKTELQRLETLVLQRRGGAIGDALVAFGGPMGLPIKAALVSLIPLFGRRGRRHYVRAVQELNPFGGSSDPSVNKSSAPLASALSLLRAWGFLHSNEASAKAAEAPVQS